MIKFKQGYIQNNEGVGKDIVVKSAAPNKLSDLLIGGVMVMIGITYLTVTAFKNGSEKFEEAEYQTLDKLGLLK